MADWDERAQIGGVINRLSLQSARLLAPADFRRWSIGGVSILAIGYTVAAAIAAATFGVDDLGTLRATPIIGAAVACLIALLVTVRGHESAGVVLALAVSWCEIHYGFSRSTRFPPIGMLVPPLLIIGVGLLLGRRSATVATLGSIVAGVLAMRVSPVMRDTGFTPFTIYALSLYSIILCAAWALLALSMSGFGRVFDELRAKERDLADTIRFAPDGILVIDAAQTVLLANPGAEAVLDLPVDRIVGRRIDEVFAASMRGELVPAAFPRDTGEPPLALELRRADGTAVHVEATWRRMEGDRRQLLLRDVSERVRADAERRTMEMQLAQVQRMEAVAQLAGGLSHDFNNILTTVGGSAELLRGETDPVEQSLLLDEILSARDRGAGLTRQLLAFARREVLQPRVLDLSVQIRALHRMLQRVAGDQQIVALDLEAGCHVRVDIGQIEHSLVNLVSNARDAMPDGGTCTISTSRVTIPDGTAHVRLVVADTGVGMTPQVVERAFEPFFTTKARGRGTGLGLASVHAVAANGRGTARIESAPGRGTRVIIELPFVEGTSDYPVSTPVASIVPEPRRTILLAEDDAGARSTVERMLRLGGYDVLVAADGLEALAVLQSPPAPIDLLLTDVMMPGLTGPALAERVRTLHPEMPVLFMSGYAEEAVADLGDWSADRDLITKPFARQTLMSRVAEILQSSAIREAAAGG